MRTTNGKTTTLVLLVIAFLSGGVLEYIALPRLRSGELGMYARNYGDAIRDFVQPYLATLIDKKPQWLSVDILTDMDHAIVAYGVLFFVLVMYLLPTIFVLRNGNKIKKYPTILVNLLFGWTIIGWFVAFGMGVSNDRF